MALLDRLARRLDIPSLPTETEVMGALDAERWRTKYRILELIDESRKQSGESTIDLERRTAIDLIGWHNDRLLSILRRGEKTATVQMKPDNELSIAEMGASDDLRISSASAIHAARKNRGGRSQMVYRLKGERSRRTEYLGDVEREPRSLLEPTRS